VKHEGHAVLLSQRCRDAKRLGPARPASICGLLVARGLQQYEEYLKLAR
jgi:hypothetical protein